MKIFAGFVCAIICSLNPTNACTTFFINYNGQMVFGRNYDWMTDIGFLHTNLKGLAKTSTKTKDGKTISWVSKYGSLTFNQYGKEFPTGGMNENGLVVEIMMLPETNYPKPDQKAAMSELQWVQYQLDNCSTVAEVIATNHILRISAIGNVPIHFLIADSTGNAATIEYLNGKMKVHTGKDLPFAVLTNSTYQNSCKSHTNKALSNNSLERFSIAANRVTKYATTAAKSSIIDYAFETLNQVAQGSHTKWSIVYDVKNKKIYFKTNQYKLQKNIVFSEVDFSCTSTPLFYNINQAKTGNINTSMKIFDAQQNEKNVRLAIQASADDVQVTEQDIQLIVKYPATVKCNN